MAFRHEIATPRMADSEIDSHLPVRAKSIVAKISKPAKAFSFTIREIASLISAPMPARLISS
jgi:hypothetical protein